MADISKIREKIAALLKRNTGNGASEAEAMAAMSHASRLMKEHGISIEDIRENTTASTDFVKARFNHDSKQLNIFDSLLATAIARYTDTKVWNDKTEKGVSKLMFFGYRVDVELAEYIREMCIRAGDTEWKKFSQALPKGSRHRVRKSFFAGMAIRLAQRLQEIKKDMLQENGGRELVVLKSEMVLKAFSNENMKLKSSGHVRYHENKAYDAGKAAGNRVRFNRAVHDGPAGGVKLIA